MTVLERLLKYASFDTASDESSETCPSTEKQRTLALALAEEMRALGLVDVEVDEHSYVYGAIPSNTGSDGLCIGFIAHLDTVADVPSHPIMPEVIKYTGGDITLKNGTTIAMSEYPELLGRHLLVTDGNTLLGADDKAGIAEILSMAEYLHQHPELPHGRIAIAFTPDEEIGRGADQFDVARFGAQAAYTVDGGAVGEVEYETFNAASATVTVTGYNVHPGSAKGKMRNASRIAMEFDASIPTEERPETTEGYEGFFHLIAQSGGVERAELSYILRDHDADKLEEKKQRMQTIADGLNQRYGEGTVNVAIADSYRNMAEPIREHWYLVEKAYAAVEQCGGTPVSRPVRGGTDGARLSFMGLPCPNLGTGGYNFHSRTEFACVEQMEQSVRILTTLACSYADE